MGRIVVTHLGKAYRQYPHRWSRLIEWLGPKHQPRHRLHWVLQDINFVINPGEAVGLIGINGAGKSTLLKMITGTTQPTTGHVDIQGRVAALLELGMGFHPDFTGRQNCYMSGQLMGFTVEEIHALMPEIEAFAEIGDYMDQPVRLYSSGMQMRVAFSVATARRPDILIVDEALSVGDAYFQHKSFERIREFGKQGTTLLLVSHDKSAIQSICDQAILLNAGKMGMQGDPEAVFDYYNALLADRQNQKISQETNENGKIQTVSGTGDVTVVDIALLNQKQQPIEVVDVGQKVLLRVVCECKKPIDKLVFGFMIKDRVGQTIFGTTTESLGTPLPIPELNIPFVLGFELNLTLGPGTYSIATALADSKTHLSKNYEWKELALIFNVVNFSKNDFIGTSFIDVTPYSACDD